ncbi:MAG: cobalamin biosynthesis protein CobD [Clostridia bacterium]|nr:cobalamin biosynthesis protein CobD [Clostridia bacterium]
MNKDYVIALIIGFILDAILGDPEWLYHPVCIIGRYISWAEKKIRLHSKNLRAGAVILTASTVVLTMFTVFILICLARFWGHLPCIIVLSLLDWMGLAARSMVSEAYGVRRALDESLQKGRHQVARIVGRDTASLSREEVIKATVETVAENTTDGVISPMLYALGGPILLWGFKAASTLDSMVGYLDEHYRDIGWSSARLDDLLNYVPARLTGILMILSSFLLGLDGKNAFRIMVRDHRNHKSPNCAWSESATAGALHIQLGGTHDYFGKPVEKPFIGDNDRDAVPDDIHQSCRLLCLSSLLLLTFICLLNIFLLKIWVS